MKAQSQQGSARAESEAVQKFSKAVDLRLAEFGKRLKGAKQGDVDRLKKEAKADVIKSVDALLGEISIDEVNNFAAVLAIGKAEDDVAKLIAVSAMFQKAAVIRAQQELKTTQITEQKRVNLERQKGEVAALDAEYNQKKADISLQAEERKLQELIDARTALQGTLDDAQDDVAKLAASSNLLNNFRNATAANERLAQMKQALGELSAQYQIDKAQAESKHAIENEINDGKGRGELKSLAQEFEAARVSDEDVRNAIKGLMQIGQARGALSLATKDFEASLDKMLDQIVENDGKSKPGCGMKLAGLLGTVLKGVGYVAGAVALGVAVFGVLQAAGVPITIASLATDLGAMPVVGSYLSGAMSAVPSIAQSLNVLPGLGAAMDSTKISAAMGGSQYVVTLVNTVKGVFDNKIAGTMLSLMGATAATYIARKVPAALKGTKENQADAGEVKKLAEFAETLSKKADAYTRTLATQERAMSPGVRRGL
jgi:hypothetical protein